MFRFNNPDALLTLLLIGSVYATIRAIEAPERAVRWLVLGGSLVGFAFLTKMMQAFLVLPPLALVYLIAAQPTVLTRLRHLLIAFGSMIAAAGWWIAIVELWPASSRPYIGGSQNNSILELTLGYNGFGRLSGNEVGSVGGGTRGGGSGWGATGIGRMFSSEIGGQIAWLLPAAIALLVLGLWFRRTAGRRDRQLTRPRRLGRVAARHRARHSASWLASSTRTTPSCSLRRSPHSSASARASCGSTARRPSPASARRS